MPNIRDPFFDWQPGRVDWLFQRLPFYQDAFRRGLQAEHTACITIVRGYIRDWPDDVQRSVSWTASFATAELLDPMLPSDPDVSTVMSSKPFEQRHALWTSGVYPQYSLREAKMESFAYMARAAYVPSYDMACNDPRCQTVSGSNVPKYHAVSDAHRDTGTARMNVQVQAKLNTTDGEGVERAWDNFTSAKL
ncbi:hypothetical protein PENSPDRAFT_694039 [Peniophora sp. CONT]|nr:hypothetical protein PENSPDRAFT_694039 [Peniophora sp. CONT]